MNDKLETYEKAILDRICAVCIDRHEDGTCGLDPSLRCSIREHLPSLLELFDGVSFDNMAEYVERVRNNVCTVCNEGNRNGTCAPRDHIDCTLDRYLALVVEAIEDVERRHTGDAQASAR